MNVVILGANSAIAQAFARRRCNAKTRFLLVGRDPDKLDTVKRDLVVRGAGSATAKALDLTDLGQHKRLVADIRMQLGKIDLVLLAHGYLGDQSKAEHDLEAFKKIFDVNCLSHLSLLNEFANCMEEQKSGVLAVITSVAGDKGKRSNYIYGSAKGAVSIFLDGLRQRLDKSGVSVINLRLGFTDTPMTRDFKKGLLWAKPDQVAKGIDRAIQRGSENAYIPWFWFWIMSVICLIPEKIFKKLSL